MGVSRLSFYLWTLTFPKVFSARTTLYSCAGGTTVEPYKTGLHGGECGELKQIRDDQGDGDVHWTLDIVQSPYLMPDKNCKMSQGGGRTSEN